jgi:hypothetical protein
MDGKPLVVEVGFILIRINVKRPVLGKGVELPCVVKHSVVPLFTIHELFYLAVEQTHR